MRALAVTLLVAAGLFDGSDAAAQFERVDMEVRLLAHHWPTATFGLTHSGLRNLFIARVENGGGQLTGQFVVLDYLHNSPRAPSIGELLSWDGTWKISATREPGCDTESTKLLLVDTTDADTGKPLEPLPALQLLPGALRIAIPRSDRLDCYRFGPQDLIMKVGSHDG